MFKWHRQWTAKTVGAETQQRKKARELGLAWLLVKETEEVICFCFEIYLFILKGRAIEEERG